jgi:hydrogenase maturation protease
MSRRILVAGIGNIFFGDDAFGVEVVGELASQAMPEGVRVVDFGIRGLDLAYELLADYELAILVDAAPRGGQPGSLYVIEPDLSALEAGESHRAEVDMHGMSPWKVLHMAAALGGPLPRVLVVGVEPTPPADPDDMQMGLSEPVQAAIGEAADMVRSLVAGDETSATAGAARTGNPQ